MKLEEIVNLDNLEGLGFTFDQDGTLLGTYLHKNDFYELIERVWNLAIEHAANHAEADLIALTDEAEYEINNMVAGHDYEVCVLTESILKLKV